MSKLAMMNLCRCIVSASRLFSGGKKTEIQRFPINHNSSHPLPALFDPPNTFVSGNVVTTSLMIPAILRWRALADIIPAIVQRVVVFVVAFFIRRTSQYLSVHGNYPTSPVHGGKVTPRIKSFGVFVPLSKPIPSGQPLEISDINDGVLPLRERDESVRLVERLGNGVPLLRLSGHRSSLKGLLVLSRYSIIATVLSLVFLPSAKAQSGFTTVQATVRDPSGAAYVNCHGNASFVPSPSATTQALLSGSTFSTDVPISGCDSFANFTLVLADNNAITDGHAGTDVSQWRLNISSQDGKTNFTCILTITGATQNITTALQACAAPLPPTGGGGGNFVVKAVPCASTMVFTMAGVAPNTSNTAFTVALNCNVTSTSVAPPSGGTIQQGAVAQFTLTQNNVGGFPFQWPPNFIDQPSIQVAANATTNASFWYDGTNWHAQTFPAAGGGGGNSAGVLGDVQKSTGTGGFAVAGINDNGTVRVNEDIQFKGPNPYFDLTRYGGFSGAVTPQATTASTTSGSNAIIVANAIDFAVGHGIRIAKAGSATVLGTPPAPTVTPFNITGGSTSYSYQVAAEGINGDLTAASSAGSTASGQATLGVTSLALASVARVSGVTTFTLQASQNLQAGQTVNVSGFSGSLFNGVFTIASVPLATTFTVNQGGFNDNSETNAGAVAQALSCNRLTLPSNSVSSTIDTTGFGANVLRYWIWANKNAGAFLLVGVATGADPYFEDCGFNVSNVPDYVPATPPGASQPGYFATTITNIVGTAFTLAANAGQTVIAQNALHDNTPNLVLAAKALGATFNGGRILVPQGSLTAPAFVFNSTADLRNANIGYNGGKTEIIFQGLVYLNQPVIPDSGMNFTGYASVGGFSFSYGPMALATGNAYPLLLIRPPVQSVQTKNIKFSAQNNQQIAIFSDNLAGGGGATGLVFDQTGVGYSNNSWGSPWTLKGGVDMIFRNGPTCSSHTGVPWNGSYGCLRFTNSSSALVTANSQVPGRVQADNLYCSVLCVQIDSIPSNSSGGSANPTSTMGAFNFKGGIFENVEGPFVRMQMPSSANVDYVFNDVQLADNIAGAATPFVDASGSSLGNPVTFINAGTFGGPLLVVDTANIVTRPIFINSSQLFGNVISSASLNNQSGVISGGPAPGNGAIGSYLYLNNGMGITNGANGKYGYALAAPTAATGSVIAGGSNPVGAAYLAWTAVDQNGYESSLSIPATVTFTTGNQQVGTASCTTPTPTAAVQGFNLYWSNGGGYAKHNSTLLAACTLSNVTVLSNFGTFAGAPANGTSSSIDSNGLTTYKFRLGAGTFHSDFTVPTLTANRSITWPDAGGTPALGAPFTTNGILFGNGTSLIQATAASGVGTFCLTETNGGVPVFGSCAGSAATAWSSLTNPSADLSLNMSTFNSLFTSGVMTGTRHAWEFTDGNSTSTGSLLNLHTGATSTMKPFTATAQGTANGVQMDTTGNLAPIGTGKNTANAFSGLSTNLLLYGNGSGGISSLTGSLIGTNPVLKLTSASTTNVPFALDTPASPTADIFDININAVKTSWVDNLGIWHAPSYTASGSGALALSGTEGTCPTPTSGIDILCIGNSATHTIQSSLNGAAYKDNAQFSNSGPAAHGVCLVGAIFPQLNCTSAGASGQAFVSAGASADGFFGVLGAVGGGTGNATNTIHGVGMGQGTAALNFSAAGTTGQPFLSGGAGADGAYGALNLAGGASIVTGVLPLANVNPNIVTVTGAITPNDCVKWSSATVVTDSGGTCGGAGGSARLDQLLGATASNTINSTIFPQTWNWALTGSTTAFKFGENTAATGSSNVLLQVSTLLNSTALPFRADSNGDGVSMTIGGLLQPLGNGGIKASTTTLTLNTTSPITGGGPLTGNMTFACATCVANNITNTAASAMILDMSGATGTSALRVPNLAGAAPTVNGVLSYDTTNNMVHFGVNGADARAVITTISPTDTFCAQWTRTSGHYELGQAAATCSSGGGTTLQVVGAGVNATANLNSTTPALPTSVQGSSAAPAVLVGGAIPITFQKDASATTGITAYTSGFVPLPNYRVTRLCLANGAGTAGNPIFCDLGDKVQAINTITTLTSVASTSTTPPLAKMITGSATTVIGYQSATAVGLFTGTNLLYQAGIKLEDWNATPATWNERIMFGLGSTGIVTGASDTPTGYGGYFRASSNVPDTNFQCMVANNAAATATDSGVAVDNSFHRFQIFFNDSTGHVLFYIDNVQKCDVSSGVPATGNSMRRLVSVQPLTATSKAISVAWDMVQGDQ